MIVGRLGCEQSGPATAKNEKFWFSTANGQQPIQVVRTNGFSSCESLRSAEILRSHSRHGTKCPPFFHLFQTTTQHGENTTLLSCQNHIEGSYEQRLRTGIAHLVQFSSAFFRQAPASFQLSRTKRLLVLTASGEQTNSVGDPQRI